MSKLCCTPTHSVDVTPCVLKMAEAKGGELYRADGVRILHDPYAPEMVEKYGRPGHTDEEVPPGHSRATDLDFRIDSPKAKDAQLLMQGFNPYADTVGPGIYGGIVKRDEAGKIVIGQQYQNHNPRPGPVYAGGGYTPMSKALRQGQQAVASLLDKFPDLVNEVSTGGATPLHMCGMGRDSQHVTAYIISRGGDCEAVDTYGYRPLHRMASNNLAIGAEALLEAGADPKAKTYHNETPLGIAQEARAHDVVAVLRQHLDRRLA